MKIFSISHGLTDTFTSIYFACHPRFIYCGQFPGSCLLRKQTCLRNTVSLWFPKAVAYTRTKHRRYRASCWLAAAASGYFMRDLLWNTQWCFFLVIVRLVEDRGIRLVVEADVGLITCAWGPASQWAKLPSERSGSGNSPRWQDGWRGEQRGRRCGAKWRERRLIHAKEWHDNADPRMTILCTRPEPCEVRMSAVWHKHEQNCACCARLVGCDVHTPRRVLSGSSSKREIVFFFQKLWAELHQGS